MFDDVALGCVDFVKTYSDYVCWYCGRVVYENIPLIELQNEHQSQMSVFFPRPIKCSALIFIEELRASRTTMNLRSYYIPAGNE